MLSDFVITATSKCKNIVAVHKVKWLQVLAFTPNKKLLARALYSKAA